jgi:subtilisin family serine protease
VTFFSSCGNKNESQDVTNNYPVDIDALFDNTISAYEVAENSLWTFNNNGEFSAYNYDECWENRIPCSLAGIDVNMPDNDIGFTQSKNSPIIAIIDTSVDINHPALQKGIWENDGEIVGDGIDNDHNGYIDDIYGWNFLDNNNIVDIRNEDDFPQHGTHLVGTLIGNDYRNNYKGLLADTEAKAMCLKALDSDGTGKTEDVISAIEYAEQQGASICCLSVLAANSAQLYNTLNSSNMLFIVSAGNQASNIDIEEFVFPACYDLQNMIVVTGIRSDGELNAQSNYGTKNVDVAAPGTDIISTMPSGKYGYLCGTSVSVPFVAGEAALIMMSYGIDLTPSAIKDIIIKSSKQLSELKGKVKSDGIIDIAEALASYLSSG